MINTPADARSLAESLLADREPRWSHVTTVGRSAEALAASAGLPDRVVIAAWLHDIGYASTVCRSGFHPLDGAAYLRDLGCDPLLVGLVAFHTGATCEADQRGLREELNALPQPVDDELDMLTMIDLATDPHGHPIRDRDRIAEILSRYPDGHPVHQAVSASRPSLLTASARAKKLLGLPESWPIEEPETTPAHAAQKTASPAPKWWQREGVTTALAVGGVVITGAAVVATRSGSAGRVLAGWMGKGSSAPVAAEVVQEMVKRAAPKAHAVAGHRKMVAYGAGRALRKEVQVAPYLRGGGAV